MKKFDTCFKQTDHYVISIYNKVLNILKKLSLNSKIVKDEISKADLYIKRDKIKFPTVFIIINKLNISK